MKYRTLYMLSAVFMALLFTAGCGKEAHKAPAAKKKPPAAVKAEIKNEEPKPAIIRDERSRLLTMTARILAGIPAADGYAARADILERDSFRKHSKKMTSLWKINEKERLAKLSEWAKKYLEDVDTKDGAVFYPFGGPDCLYPTAFFPSASSYYLIGLEPVGSVPDLLGASEKEFEESLSGMHDALAPILQISFFRTNDMKTELVEPGVTPLIMTMLAGSGYEIIGVAPLSLKEDGTFAPSEWGRKETKAVEIDFAKTGTEELQKLFYVSQDISNNGISKNGAFLAFLDNLSQKATFLKAATYLLHKPYFSVLRDRILDKSPVVLQDDSGIPYNCFKRDSWEIRLFGSYQGPIKLFEDKYEEDLAEAYKSPEVQPLPFGIGYQHWANRSNLLLAKKRAAVAD